MSGAESDERLTLVDAFETDRLELPSGKAPTSDELDVGSVIAVAEFRAQLRRFLRQNERVARKAGLTPQRYLLLLMIKGAPDRSERATVTGLARRLQLAQSSVTELVARAEECGLLTRAPSEQDGRIVHLRLTDEGERKLHRCLTTLESERRLLRQSIPYLRGGGHVGGAPLSTTSTPTAEVRRYG